MSNTIVGMTNEYRSSYLMENRVMWFEAQPRVLLMRVLTVGLDNYVYRHIRCLTTILVQLYIFIRIVALLGPF